MRTVPLSLVTAGTRGAVMEHAERGTYLDVGVTVLDPTGKPAVDGKLIPNGCIVVDSYYVDLILYMLDSGEVVQLEGGE